MSCRKKCYLFVSMYATYKDVWDVSEINIENYFPVQ